MSLAEKYKEVYAAIGVHPNSALSWDSSSLDELRELAVAPSVVAIGEIGLDYYRDHSPHQLQKKIFRAQLDLASELNLPVIIHNRQATDDILEILRNWYKLLSIRQSSLQERPGVLHSFSDDDSIARNMFSYNFMIGITGPVTFKNAHNLQRTISKLSLDNILIETDSPFLTPHPHRGSRNEPTYVKLIADKIAQLQGLSVENVEKITTANSDRMFNWREIG